MDSNFPGGTARDLGRELAPFPEWWVVQGAPLSQGPQDSLAAVVETDLSTR